MDPVNSPGMTLYFKGRFDRPENENNDISLRFGAGETQGRLWVGLDQHSGDS